VDRRTTGRLLDASGPMFGGMAEWLKAPVLKTGERKLRGFESYSLRQSLCGEVAEWLKAAAC
jgi:hypothetical protein